MRDDRVVRKRVRAGQPGPPAVGGSGQVERVGDRFQCPSTCVILDLRCAHLLLVGCPALGGQDDGLPRARAGDLRQALLGEPRGHHGQRLLADPGEPR